MQGLALTPDDAWSVHSVAHVYEMKAEVDKGLKFMESGEKDWQVPLYCCSSAVCFSDGFYIGNLAVFHPPLNSFPKLK